MCGQTYRRWIYTTIKEKVLWEHRPSEAWFLSYDLLNKKKMLTVSTWIFKTEHCRSEQWLPYPSENSKSHVYHLKFILYLLLQVLDDADFCSMKSRLQMSPWDKNLSDMKPRNKQAMLLVLLILPIVLKK